VRFKYGCFSEGEVTEHKHNRARTTHPGTSGKRQLIYQVETLAWSRHRPKPASTEYSSRWSGCPLTRSAECSWSCRWWMADAQTTASRRASVDLDQRLDKAPRQGCGLRMGESWTGARCPRTRSIPSPFLWPSPHAPMARPGVVSSSTLARELKCYILLLRGRYWGRKGHGDVMVKIAEVGSSIV
jgi:hypothetical protein